ncbi:MAG: AAA family ATPase [Candidatus Hydrogenedentes bacterium]|nr:AAA family ATPase [Candidatus Hydrogenedentota bacterium]
MYLGFYGLSKEPFHIAPDPEFFYMSKGHREALASVLYGVDKGLGFISLTGEVGTGKTTVLRTYLERIRKSQVRAIYLFNSNQTFDSLLTYLLDQFDVDSRAQSEYWKLQALTRELIYELGRNRRVVLVIDEAHQMPVETFKKLHLISNLELPDQKLLQIILTGQPELDEKLNTHELRQIRQRVAVRARLNPLTVKESIDYINHRIMHADGNPEKVMTLSAMKAVAHAAKGFPREINVLCDNALINGYGYKAKPVTKRITRSVVQEFSAVPRVRSWRWLTAGLLATVLFGLMGAFVYATASASGHVTNTQVTQPANAETGEAVR